MDLVGQARSPISKCASAVVLKTPHLNHQLIQMNTVTLSCHLENAHKMQWDCGLPSSREVLMYSVHRWRKIEWYEASSIERWNCHVPECLGRVQRGGVFFPLVFWLGFLNSGEFVHKRRLYHICKSTKATEREPTLAFPNSPWRNTITSRSPYFSGTLSCIAAGTTFPSTIHS